VIFCLHFYHTGESIRKGGSCPHLFDVMMGRVMVTNHNLWPTHFPSVEKKSPTENAYPPRNQKEALLVGGECINIRPVLPTIISDVFDEGNLFKTVDFQKNSDLHRISFCLGD